MCTPNHNSLLTYGLKVPAPAPYFPLNPATSPLSALDLHRSQLCEYNARVQLSLRGYTHALTGLSPYHGAYLGDPYTHYLYKGDPRARFVQEEPKPSHSYIGLIAMAILSSKEKKLVLSDIYQWILDNYPYFRTRGPGWRNSIRHNLSLNDCFIKAGRSANGKGHYWAVHPANVDDFTRGDFRRRRAQRKVRKHMGLSVPDDDDDSPSPSPNPISWVHNGHDSAKGQADHEDSAGQEEGDADEAELDPGSPSFEERHSSQTSGQHFVSLPTCGMAMPHVSKKRLFDVESLLAPDLPVVVMPKVRLLPSTVSSSHQAAYVGPYEQSSRVPGSDGTVCEDSDVDIETEDVPASDPVTLSTDSHKTRRQDTGDTTSLQDTVTEMGDEEELCDDTRPTPTSASTTSAPTASMAPLPACTATTALDLSSSACIPSKLLSNGQPGQAGLPHSLIVATNAEGHRLIGRRPLGGMDLGSGRYSAFQSTGTGSLRAALPPSVVPFLHPVLAVSRYPTPLPPTLSKPAHLPERVDSLAMPCIDEASVDSDKI